MKLLKYPNPALLTPCPKGVFPVDSEWQAALEVCRLNGGVALAAPQIGIAARWWVELASGKVYFDPYLAEKSIERALCAEGCLSLPGCSSKVRRHQRITLWSWVRDSQTDWSEVLEEREGLSAQIAQHELDHLKGKLYTSYLSSAERSRIHGTARKRR